MDIIKGSVTLVHVMELQVSTYLQSLFLKSLNASVVPKLWNAKLCRHGEPGIFLHMHDVIKIGPEF